MSKHTPESSNQRFIVKAGRSSIALVAFQADRSDEANALLTAAAPKMLSACRAALGVLYASKSQGKQFNERCLIAINLLEDAIEKAQGAQ